MRAAHSIVTEARAGLSWCAVVAAMAWVFLPGCASVDRPEPIPGRPAPVDSSVSSVSSAPMVTESTAETVAPAPSRTEDGPHISRSVGEDGGVIVFWPRVIPSSDDAGIRDLAGELQRRLVELTNKVVGDRRVDVRPEPERVCPRMGCAAMTVGVLLTHQGGGCTAVALVSGSGKGAAQLVPWAGKVELKKTEVPFRDYPESQVTIRDAIPCKDLIAALADADSSIRGAIKAVAGRQ